MTNPALLFLSGNATLAGEDSAGPVSAIATGALRYRPGILAGTQAFFIEDGTINLIVNPRFEVDTTPWTPIHLTLTRSSAQTGVGSFSAKTTVDDLLDTPVLGLIGANRIPVSPSLPYTLSGRVFGTATRAYTMQLQWHDSGSVPIGAAIIGPATVATGGAWESLVPITATAPANAATAEVLLQIEVAGALVGDVAYFDAIQFEQQSYASSYADGSLGTGYTWSGVAHASSSTRAATTVTIEEVGHILPERGALAFHVRRPVDTGDIDGLFAAGAYNVTDKDALFVQINANDRMNARWRWGSVAQGAGEIAVSPLTATVVGQAAFVYVDWDGANMRCFLDSDSASGVREVAGDIDGSGIWIGSLTSLSFQANSVIGPIIICDRPLSDAERTGLQQATAWRFDMLAAVADLSAAWTTNAPLSVRRGDTFEQTATITAGGVAFDLTGGTLWWTLKLASDFANNDDTAKAKLFWVDGGSSAGIAVSTPTTGTAVVTLTPAQTDVLVVGEAYLFDLQVADSIGRIFTVDTGQLFITSDITRRITTP